MTTVCYDYKSNTYGVEVGGDFESHDPASFRDWLVDKLESNRETAIWWIWGLDLIALDIIRTLWHIGFHDITRDALPIKKWKVKDFDYAIGTNDVCYRIRIKGRGEKTIAVYNAACVLGKDIDAINKSFGGGSNSIESKTIAVRHGINALVGSQKKRIPYTISMIAMKRWRELEHMDFSTPELIDCYKWQSLNGPEDPETLDGFIRKAYRGGWCYLSEHGHSYTGSGVVYDVNSLYPFMAARKPLPWGEPTYFKGEIPEDVIDSDRHYYYVSIKCTFDIKPGFFPYISINDFTHRWGEPLDTSDYIDYSGIRHKEYVDRDGTKHKIVAELTLSKTDYEMMKKVYTLNDVEIIGGVYFLTTRFAFNDFVDYFYSLKQECRASGDRATEKAAKMILNSCIGGFAKIQDRTGIVFDFDKDGDVFESVIRTHSQSKSHIHIAAAILAYAREFIYNAAMANHDRFMYCDTDSIHLSGLEPASGITVSDKLGDFKEEHRFHACDYFKRKMYGLQEEKGVSLTMAGISKEYRTYIEDLLNRQDDFRNMDINGFCIESDFFKKDIGPVWTVDFRDFEEKIYDCKSVVAALDLLRMEPIPNGYRTCEDFRSTLVHQFAAIA